MSALAVIIYRLWLLTKYLIEWMRMLFAIGFLSWEVGYG